jgi:Putative beta-barrel porin-2, OmpL-like. bbp2
MKFNKWTLGLAAVGLVSLNSAANADDAAPASTVLTALSSTTLSGYVDTSAQWNLGTGNANSPNYSFGGASKADGFNLNVVQLSLDKPLDESEWASGYHVDMWLGPDANALGTQSIGADGTADFAIRQAYVTLRTPVGNGIDWKIGVFDTVIGYESLASPNNPNYTHSYGFTIEPTTHTGILGTYKINDMLNVSAGIANTFGPSINEKAQGPNLSDGGRNHAESYKTYMAAVAFTAPSSWGWVGGSTLSAGVVNGFNSAAGDFGGGAQTSFYAGATVNTPMTALKLGASLDYLNEWAANRAFAAGDNPGFTGDGSAWAGALYASFQATEKLSLNLRGEFLDDSAGIVADNSAFGQNRAKIWAATATAQYDLWKNVISRVEFRWDHADNGKFFGANSNSSAGTGGPSRRNAFLLAAQVIYKF